MTYVKKLRDDGNTGSRYGTLVHLIFECLANPRHAHYVEKIYNLKNIYQFKSFERLIIKTAAKIGLDLQEIVKLANKSPKNQTVHDLINQMVLVGLEVDFMDAAKELIKAELDFDITDEEKEYRYLGFIDRIL